MTSLNNLPGSARVGPDQPRARSAPPRESAGSRLGVVADPVLAPAPSRPDPAGSARSSLNPRGRLLEVRARGLSDVLAG